MKKLIIIIIISTLFSCKSKFNNNGEDLTTLDLIHTDSFSPKNWETPINRKYINFGDYDIGELLQKSVIDPKLHAVYNTTERFFQIVSNSKLDDLKEIMITPAYNSFILRFNGISFIDVYELRIEKPKSIDDSEFKLRIKLIFEEKNVIGRIGYGFNDEQCMIFDFEDKLFYDIIKSTTPIKEKTTEDNTIDSGGTTNPIENTKDKTTDIVNNNTTNVNNTTNITNSTIPHIDSTNDNGNFDNNNLKADNEDLTADTPL